MEMFIMNQYYFFPEFLSVPIEDFELKQEIGENDSYVCSLIRQDSVAEFISYVNQTNLCLSNYIIKTSIFETNPFLIENKPTILEYATFFGAIQIIKYMMMNQIVLTPSLWLYAIHSNCAEIIQILEDNDVNPEDNNYMECFKEAVKCHHNDIAYYIKDNFIYEEYFKLELDEYVLRYYNFANFPDIFEPNFIFNHLCEFDYYTVVDYYLTNNKVDLKEVSIPISFAHENDNLEIVYLILSKTKKIDTNCFKGCKKIRNFNVPKPFSEYIKTINNNAFALCTLLKYIKIPSSVTSIEYGVFDGCYSLERITIPSSVSFIGAKAFNQCWSLKQISIFSWSLDKIKNNTFNMCKSLNEIIVPCLVTSIEENAFNECSSLECVIIPSLLSIGDGAFCGCSSLKKIKVRNSLYEPESDPIEIPSSVVRIGEYAFSGCEKIRNFKIPYLVKEICDGTFSDCFSLTYIKIPKSVTRIGNYSFDGCSSLNNVDLPPSLSQIGLCAFRGCSSMKNITIPPSVSQIGTYCFNNNYSSINDIKLSLIILLFKKSIFCDCKELSSITFLNKKIYINI